jgi:hypothetical protein
MALSEEDLTLTVVFSVIGGLLAVFIAVVVWRRRRQGGYDLLGANEIGQ